jgi:hypothetical protein
MATSTVALMYLTMTTTTPASNAQDGGGEPGGFAFTREFLRLTELALRLSNVVYSSTAAQDPTMFVYRDEPDQALVTKIDGHCFGAFRGTVFHSWDDWMQNFNLGDSVVCNEAGGCCQVQNGPYEAYFRTNYHETFEDALRDCAASCSDAPCPVLLVGHSQG